MTSREGDTWVWSGTLQAIVIMPVDSPLAAGIFASLGAFVMGVITDLRLKQSTRIFYKINDSALCERTK